MKLNSYSKSIGLHLGVALSCCFLLLFPFAVSAQTTVKGTVTDKVDGSPLIGVGVTVKGTKSGTTTDTRGNFSISVTGNPATLVFSYLGYNSQEIAISSSRTNLSVQLQPASNQLNDVVVVGYGTQRRSDITGALSSINSEEINRNRTTDLLTAMQGKLSGVQITSQSGELGSGLNIKVRGSNSINGLSSPLFVIDGIQMDVYSNEVAGSSLATSTTPNPLQNINPADIESIEVLKDASATAIYGSRGSNGVVLITTKSGKAGKTSLDYDGNLRFGNLAKKITMLSPQEFLDYRYSKSATDETALAMDRAPKDGIIDADIVTHDWQDELYETSVSQSHTLTVSGGTKTTVFSGSLNYLKDQGLINVNTNDRYGVRLRVDHQYNDKIKIGINLNSSLNELYGATNSGGAFQGITRRILLSRPADTQLLTTDVSQDGYDEYVSPSTDINDGYKDVFTNKTLLNAYANYNITKDLIFNISAGTTFSSSKGKEFYSSKTIGGAKQNGLAYINDISNYSWQNSNQLTYKKQFNKSNSLNLIGVFEISSYGYSRNGMSAQNFADQSLGINNIASAQTINGLSSYRWKNNRVSFLSRANYNLMDRYLFTASIRADGSDKFGDNQKFGYFPSGAFAWKISEEKFMQKVDAISNLKLRLSYGTTGNERIDPYTFQSLVNNSNYASNGTVLPGQSAFNPGNQTLRWEESTQYDAGLDFGFLKNKIDFSADYYVKQTKGMLLDAQLPAQAGYAFQWQNSGRIDNHGYEFTLNSRNITKKNFNWSTNFNFSRDVSKIKSLGESQSLPVTISGEIKDLGRLIVGEQFGTGYGYVFDGIYQTSDFDASGVLKPGIPNLNGYNVQPGWFKFRDLSGPKGVPDGVINDYDQTIISHSSPKFTAGLTNTLNFKNFDFSVFVEGVYGRDVLNMIKYNLTGFKPRENVSADFYHNQWSPANPSNRYGISSQQNLAAGLTSSFYSEDASYLKVRNITLGYNLPANMVSRIGIGRARLYVTANDYITWTKYSGYDPEVSFKNNQLTGVDGGTYPRTKTIVAGATINF